MVIRFFTIFFIPLLFLTSCVESEEEIWIEKDGSGRLRIHQVMPTLALAEIGDPATYVKVMREIDAEEDGIELQALSYEMEGTELVFHLEASFENVLGLHKIAEKHEARFLEATGVDPETMAAVSGETKVGLDGLSPTFERIISLASVVPGMAKAMPGLLGDGYFNYVIHLPTEVKNTNAHHVSEDRKTVSWTFLLKDHLEEPMVMRVKSSLPVPWWSWALLALLTVLIIRFLMRKLRRG